MGIVGAIWKPIASMLGLGKEMADTIGGAIRRSFSSLAESMAKVSGMAGAAGTAFVSGANQLMGKLMGDEAQAEPVTTPASPEAQQARQSLGAIDGQVISVGTTKEKIDLSRLSDQEVLTIQSSMKKARFHGNLATTLEKVAGKVGQCGDLTCVNDGLSHMNMDKPTRTLTSDMNFMMTIQKLVVPIETLQPTN